MARFVQFAWVLIASLTVHSVPAQSVPKVNLHFELDANIRQDFALTNPEVHERLLCNALVREITQYYWGDFCWELSADDPASTTTLSVLLNQDNSGNWELSAQFRTIAGGGFSLVIPNQRVRTSEEMTAFGPPKWSTFPELLKKWVCDEYLQINRTLIHKEMRERLPVGRGVVSAGNGSKDYAIYLPGQFGHFDRSRFRIIGSSPDLKVKGTGFGSSAMLGTWECIRLSAEPENPPPPLPDKYEGTVYLVKFVKPGGEPDLSETTVPMYSVP